MPDPALTASPPPTSGDPQRPRQRKLHRWLTLTLWVVALGAATNYALVWGIIRFGPDGWQRSVNFGVRSLDAPDYTFVADGLLHHVVVDHSAWGVESYISIATDPDPIYAWPPMHLASPEPWMVVPSTLQHAGGWQRGGQQSTTSDTHAYGLPYICLMRTEAYLHGQNYTAPIGRQSFWQFEIERRTGPNYRLPLMPVWRGFAANTAVFAATWLALILLVIHPLRRASVRAWSRLQERIEASQRGKCIKCGYPRADLPEPHTPCPECGSRQF